MAGEAMAAVEALERRLVEVTAERDALVERCEVYRAALEDIALHGCYENWDGAGCTSGEKAYAALEPGR